MQRNHIKWAFLMGWDGWEDAAEGWRGSYRIAMIDSRDSACSDGARNSTGNLWTLCVGSSVHPWAYSVWIQGTQAGVSMGCLSASLPCTAAKDGRCERREVCLDQSFASPETAPAKQRGAQLGKPGKCRTTAACNLLGRNKDKNTRLIWVVNDLSNLVYFKSLYFLLIIL